MFSVRTLTRVILLCLFAVLLEVSTASASTNPIWGITETPCGSACEVPGLADDASINVRLDRVEFSPVPDVSVYDSKFSNAATYGIRLLPLLNDYSPTCAFPNQATMTQFTAAMVSRYGPGGSFWIANPQFNSALAPTYFELLNEPDLTYCFKPELYADLVKSAVTAGRVANPSAKYLIYSGGTVGSKSYSPITWVSRMFKAVPTLCQYTDELAAHPYSGAKLMQEGRDEFIKFGCTKNLWITELGYDTSCGSQLCSPSQQASNESQQASWLQGWINYVKSTSWVNAFVYFQQRDSADTFEYGFWRQDNSAKPAEAIYANAASSSAPLRYRRRRIQRRHKHIK